jgi:hypothetical protein
VSPAFAKVVIDTVLLETEILPAASFAFIEKV